MNALDKAIRICEIAASTPREPDSPGWVNTGAITNDLGWHNGRFGCAALDLAIWARDTAAKTGDVHRRTQETDAEAVCLLVAMRERRGPRSRTREGNAR